MQITNDDLDAFMILVNCLLTTEERGNICTVDFEVNCPFKGVEVG